MKAELSALMDDDLDERAAAAVLDGLARDADLRRDWGHYHLIRDSLQEREVHHLSADFTARCMAALDREPTVLAPKSAPAARKASSLRFALPLAASVMGVGAVAWVAQTLQGPREMLVAVPTPPAQAIQATMASVAVAPSAGRQAQPQTVQAYVGAPVRIQPVSQMREYLVAHEAYSPLVAVQGAARYQGGMMDIQPAVAR